MMQKSLRLCLIASFLRCCLYPLKTPSAARTPQLNWQCTTALLSTLWVEHVTYQHKQYNTFIGFYVVTGQLETVEMETGNGKLKWKMEMVKS